MDKYVGSTGRDLLAPMNRAREVGVLVKLLVAEDSPLQSFDFVDRRTGEQVRLDFHTVESMAFRSWYSKTEQESSYSRIEQDSWGLGTEHGWSHPRGEQDMTGAAYIIDDIVSDLANAFIVTPKARRSGDRRNISRRKDED